MRRRCSLPPRFDHLQLGRPSLCVLHRSRSLWLPNDDTRAERNLLHFPVEADSCSRKAAGLFDGRLACHLAKNLGVRAKHLHLRADELALQREHGRRIPGCYQLLRVIERARRVLLSQTHELFGKFRSGPAWVAARHSVLQKYAFRQEFGKEKGLVSLVSPPQVITRADRLFRRHLVSDCATSTLVTPSRQAAQFSAPRRPSYLTLCILYRPIENVNEPAVATSCPSNTLRHQAHRPLAEPVLPARQHRFLAGVRQRVSRRLPAVLRNSIIGGY